MELQRIPFLHIVIYRRNSKQLGHKVCNHTQILLREFLYYKKIIKRVWALVRITTILRTVEYMIQAIYGKQFINLNNFFKLQVFPLNFIRHADAFTAIVSQRRFCVYFYLDSIITLCLFKKVFCDLKMVLNLLIKKNQQFMVQTLGTLFYYLPNRVTN